VYPDVVIGATCTLRQCVTIADRSRNRRVPTIGSRVQFGAYAQVLGGMHIDNNRRIGAMAVVLEEIPEAATAFGVPARVIVRGTKRT
jgi:serine O-acetyltransferase